MKALLNVDGKKYSVSSIFYDGNQVSSVTAASENGAVTYHDVNCSWAPANANLLYLSELLEFPTIEKDVADKWKKLIEHLEEVIVDEDSMLTHIAISAMEGKGLPFDELSLIESQKEYKLTRQRVNGVIDTVEEVKVFMEGWYMDDDTTTADETEVANQTT